MSLSMDEQRMLAEIEQRLSAEDPRLAAKLSAFRRPGPAGRFQSPRGRIIGSLFAVALVAIISMMVYAMVPFRAHGPKTTQTPQTSTSAPANPASSAAASVVAPGTSAPAQGSTHASSPATANTATAKTTTTAKTSAS